MYCDILRLGLSAQSASTACADPADIIGRQYSSTRILGCRSKAVGRGAMKCTIMKIMRTQRGVAETPVQSHPECSAECSTSDASVCSRQICWRNFGQTLRAERAILHS